MGRMKTSWLWEFKCLFNLLFLLGLIADIPQKYETELANDTQACNVDSFVAKGVK